MKKLTKEQNREILCHTLKLDYNCFQREKTKLTPLTKGTIVMLFFPNLYNNDISQSRNVISLLQIKILKFREIS